MLVSFVIPAFNEEALLPGTIRAIRDASTGIGIEHEIVVADDDSDDGTVRVARDHGASVVTVENRQIAATRNAGARSSVGEMIIWVDADTQVSAGAVGGAIREMALGAPGGGARIVFDRPCPLYARVLLPIMMALYPVARLASGAFIFCTRECFERTGGFDETMYAGEEALFARAIARCGRFAWVRDPVVTSSRKLRAYSALEIARLSAALAFGGIRGARTRKGKDIWYAPRRPDPIALDDTAYDR